MITNDLSIIYFAVRRRDDDYKWFINYILCCKKKRMITNDLSIIYFAVRRREWLLMIYQLYTSL